MGEWIERLTDAEIANLDAQLERRMHSSEVERLTAEIARLRAERDAALAERDEARDARDALASHLAKANAANSSADLIKQAVAGNRFATEVQAIKDERDAALAERYIYGSEVIRVIERNTDLIIERDAAVTERDKFDQWNRESRAHLRRAEAERDAALADRDLVRAHHRSLWWAVEAARSVFSEDGVRDVVSAFVQYQAFEECVAELLLTGEQDDD